MNKKSASPGSGVESRNSLPISLGARGGGCCTSPEVTGYAAPAAAMAESALSIKTC